MPEFGGLFAFNMNDRCTFGPENEETVKQIVLEESAQKWPDITIIHCEVTAIVNKREWLVKIIAQDKLTKMILSEDNLYLQHE